MSTESATLPATTSLAKSLLTSNLELSIQFIEKLAAGRRSLTMKLSSKLSSVSTKAVLMDAPFFRKEFRPLPVSASRCLAVPSVELSAS